MRRHLDTIIIYHFDRTAYLKIYGSLFLADCFVCDTSCRYYRSSVLHIKQPERRRRKMPFYNKSIGRHFEREIIF